MCGGIGSGCSPPKPGLRSAWISVTSTPKRAQRLGEVGLPGAVERVDRDRQARRRDRVGVDELAQVLEVGPDEVDVLELAAADRRLVAQLGLDAVRELDRARRRRRPCGS